MDVSSCTPTPNGNAGSAAAIAGEEASDAAPYEPLSKFAKLDTLVTVVDLYNVLPILCGEKNSPEERKNLVGDEEEREPEESKPLLLTIPAAC